MIATGTVQVAGVLDGAEADLLVRAGVNAIGFPLHLDYHRPDLTAAQATAIIARLPETVTPVLITYLDRAAQIIEACRSLGTSWVQIHGDIALEELKRIRDRTRLKVIKSLVVGRHHETALVRNLRQWSPFVDGFITDTFDEQTGACGATGKTHDWRISRRLVALSPRPVILAGGLNPENVREAISLVRPAGVDVHTGVESGTGRKSEHKVVQFVREARQAFANRP